MFGFLWTFFVVKLTGRVTRIFRDGGRLGGRASFYFLFGSILSEKWRGGGAKFLARIVD